MVKTLLMYFLRSLAAWPCLRVPVRRLHSPTLDFAAAGTVPRVSLTKSEGQLCTHSRKLHSESPSSEATEVELNKLDGGDIGRGSRVKSAHWNYDFVFAS